MTQAITTAKLAEQLAQMFTIVTKLSDRLDSIAQQQVAAAKVLTPPKKAAAPKPAPKDWSFLPWHLPLEEFIAFREECEADFSVGGNQQTGRALAVVLKKSSGHAEGQLYINWRNSVSADEALAFWKTLGCESIPEGL
jgi:hypothetical protein